MSNRKLVILLIVDAVLVAALFAYLKAGAMVEEVPAICPAGSYEIGRKEPGGEPICKLEPTGCPYGDSIPMEYCDKFKEQWTKAEVPAGTAEKQQAIEEHSRPFEPVSQCGK